MIEGRAEMAQDVADARDDVRAHVVASVRALLKHPDFRNALPGLLSDSDRESIVSARLAQIAGSMVS